MNAKEARATAYAHNTNKSDSQYASVMKVIGKHVSEGKYECYFNERLLDDVRKKLISESYTVGMDVTDRDGSMVKISW